MRAVALWGTIVAAAILACALMVVAPLASLAVVVLGSFAVAGVVRTRASKPVHIAPVIPITSRSAARSSRASRGDISA